MASKAYSKLLRARLLFTSLLQPALRLTSSCSVRIHSSSGHFVRRRAGSYCSNWCHYALLHVLQRSIAPSASSRSLYDPSVVFVLLSLIFFNLSRRSKFRPGLNSGSATSTATGRHTSAIALFEQRPRVFRVSEFLPLVTVSEKRTKAVWNCRCTAAM